VACRRRTDIVLLEGDSNGINGLRGIKAVLGRPPGSSVIMMSAFSGPSCRSAASRAGAMAVVSDREINGELMQVLADALGDRSENGDKDLQS
jgi:DNA-binding NarL/FixJ family response regulator